ncbi:MAG: PA2779 family protein [Hydrogenovibrio crunogenus]|uniref:PA2779 family protein n=1 Tax=Hydrogenovibrio crunogenus (strain DSM 25203 / XCL-2) TaxID=317025 RepID=Q31J07_HYDCU|nr:PA2779 family protein [Hydrogenovibrio crunogenus]
MRKTIAMSVLLSLLSVITLPVQAAMLSTQQLVQESSMTSERAKLNAMMQREDIQSQFVEMGVSPEDVQQRVAALTDAEVAELNHQMEQVPAGGDVLGVLVLIFLVFIITDIIGATDVFPFVHPVK